MLLQKRFYALLPPFLPLPRVHSPRLDQRRRLGFRMILSFTEKDLDDTTRTERAASDKSPVGKTSIEVEPTQHETLDMQ